MSAAVGRGNEGSAPRSSLTADWATSRVPTAAATNLTITVTGEVEPGANSNKWYNTWAFCRGVSARVNPEEGTFSLPGVPLYPGTNVLLVRVRDVSGNEAEQTRTVVRTNALETFEYDGSGNLTNWVKAGENWVYEWDWADRLPHVASNGVVVLQNWYDASGRRIAKAEVVNGQIVKTLYLHDGWDIVGVMNEAGQMRETFTRGVGLAGDIGTLVTVTHHPASWTNGTFYAHHNHRGDIVLTRSGATTVGRYDYAACGSLKSQTGPDVCRFTFSSKERDVSTGFSYYGYRFYSPQWQRWVSRDYIQESGGLNLYAFVINAPNGLVDPDGSEGTPTNPQPSIPWIPPFPSHPASCDKNRVSVPNCSGNAPPACPAKPPKPCTERDFGQTRNHRPAGTETKDCPGYGRITVNCFMFEKCMFWAQPLNGPTQYAWRTVRDCPCPKPPETKQ